jgi:hypothetical protein
MSHPIKHCNEYEPLQYISIFSTFILCNNASRNNSDVLLLQTQISVWHSVNSAYKIFFLHTEEYLEVRDLAGTVIKPQAQFPQHINFISYLGIKSSETLKYTRSKTT